MLRLKLAVLEQKHDSEAYVPQNSTWFFLFYGCNSLDISRCIHMFILFHYFSDQSSFPGDVSAMHIVWVPKKNEYLEARF